MSGGIPSRAISRALSAPPGGTRPISATARRPAAASPRSVLAAPNTTADRPIIAPTDRSMPPLMMTGVSATASSPSSTLSRVTSKKLPTREESSARSAANSAISPASATARQPFAVRRPAAAPRHRGQARAPGGSSARGGRTFAHCVDRDRREDDRALDGALPVRVDAEERQRRADRAEQDDAEQRAGERAAPAADRGAADDDRRNHLHLEPEAGVAGNLVEADRVEHRREAGQRAGGGEHRPLDARGVEAGQPRRVGVRAGGVDRAAGRDRWRSPTPSATSRPDRSTGARESDRRSATGRATGTTPAGPAPTRPAVVQRSASRSATIVASVTTIDGSAQVGDERRR